ncbi:hypothetical protein VHUM_00199 [Vanrija humicola]|uniref:Phosphotyrosine protein phosphatase I domain-containing protein n=1 Tax=Vanrija humicola TaxID=5417 RepID=A0A7D8V5L9_VANHU|nr:hypothetical protein VHUM_00199 [Vanrija humicola]
MAEAVIANEARLRPGLDLRIDSAGTGAYHAGDTADPRTIAVCKKNKVPINCIARRVRDSDFDEFDYILAMDQSNLQNLITRKPKHSKARIALFGTFDPDLALASPGARRQRPRAIEDPYYGGDRGFDECYEQCVRYARGFLDFLQQGGGDIPKL